MNHVGSNETLALALGLSQVEVVALRALLASSVEKGSRECVVKEDVGKSCGDVVMEGVVEVSGDCSDGESRRASSESSWSEAVELAVQAGELPSGTGEGQRGVPRSKTELSRKSSGDGGSVVMPGGVAVSSAVKEVNFFAGDGGEQKSFFGQYVRSGDMKRFKRWLKVRGVAVTNAVGAELALARYSKGSVPSAFVKGSERLAVLAKVGDNAMTLVLTDDMYGNGMSVKDVQVKCGSVLSRMALTPVCVRSGLSAFGVFPTGIDIGKSSPAGEMLEAVAGAVYHDLGVPGVKALMRALQLL